MTDPESKRRQAVAAWTKTNAQRKALVSQSLAFLDFKSKNTDATNYKNKHIKFTSDSEDENEHKKDAPRRAGKHKLFDSDDDDNKDCEMTINIKPHYLGEEGAKLRRLESKFGGDSRFSLDERFVESKKETNEIESSEKIEEKKQQFRMLEKVLGHAVEKEKLLTKQKCDQIDDSPVFGIVRYDPDNPTHYRYNKTKNKTCESRRKMAEESTGEEESTSEQTDNEDGIKEEEEPKEEIIKQTRSKAHMDTDFADEIRRLQSGETVENKPFSLLDAFDKTNLIKKDYNDSTIVKEKNKGKVEKPQPLKLKQWQQQILSGTTEAIEKTPDSSTDDEQNEKSKPSSKMESTPTHHLSFFPTLAQLKRRVSAFRRSRPKQVVLKTRLRKKNSVIISFKKARKDALRRQTVRNRQQNMHDRTK